jgi:hypothetical protein
MKKIAFCFLIYDTIIQEEIWNHFFSNVNINKYNIYIHYKTNTPLKFFERYKLKNCIETRYEDHTIPLAYNLLFREAFNHDPENEKFVIVSGACIPLKPFDYIYQQLTSDHYGYFNVCPQSQCFPHCNSLLTTMDKKYISKSHNWFILNRTLVEKLCFDKDDILRKDFSTLYAPAEYFYYTYIRLQNLENQIRTTANIAAGATTFTNWQGMNYKYVSRDGLKTYRSISKRELYYLLESKSLFGRKFTRDCFTSLTDLKYIMFITTR